MQRSDWTEGPDNAIWRKKGVVGRNNGKVIRNSTAEQDEILHESANLVFLGMSGGNRLAKEDCFYRYDVLL